ncbi:MAG TPA: hypothetical protein VGK29_25815 [Paludibaculum sp.]|jgi:Rieske Fe-S protein
MSEARRMTRRTLAALLGAGTAGVAAPAQTQPAAEADRLEAEAALVRNSEAIQKVDVPWDTEPAFRFQA